REVRMGEFVRVERDEAIATIRLDRPPMNALNAQVQDEIGAAAAEVDADPAVRAVVLFGGEKVFAAGADIKEMAEATFAQGAKDIVFTGRFVGAAEALDIGLVDKVVPDAEVYRAAHDLAARFAGGPAVALRAAKQAIDAGLEADLDTGLEIERLNFAALFATE